MLITGYIPSSSDCPLSSCSGPPVPSVATAVFEATLLLSGSEEVVGTGAADLFQTSGARWAPGFQVKLFHQRTVSAVVDCAGAHMGGFRVRRRGGIYVGWRGLGAAS